MNVFDFWIEEFGDTEQGRDCCGRIVVRSQFARYDKRYGWTVQKIAPFGSELASNLHIVHTRTAELRCGKSEFCSDGHIFEFRHIA